MFLAPAGRYPADSKSDQKTYVGTPIDKTGYCVGKWTWCPGDVGHSERDHEGFTLMTHEKLNCCNSVVLAPFAQEL